MLVSYMYVAFHVILLALIHTHTPTVSRFVTAREPIIKL